MTEDTLTGRVLSVSVTSRGRELAAGLPFAHHHGDPAATVRSRWDEVDGMVLFLATGAAVRLVAPLLADKRTDPAVVCVDESGRFAVSLCGGHARGANALAREVAALLGAEAVVTTASDATGTAAFDTIPGFVAEGDLAGVTLATLEGRAPVVDNPLGWPLPPGLAAGDGPEQVTVTDRQVALSPGRVVLRPPSLVAGVGTSSGAPGAEVAALVSGVLSHAGLSAASWTEVATIDRREAEPAIVALGRPVRSFAPRELAEVTVPTPSTVVEAAVGTPSVAEAAALLAAGPGAELVVPKRANGCATVAVARRRPSRGRVRLVGLGPGTPALRCPAATAAVRSADVVIGYGPYVDQCADLLEPRHSVRRSPIGHEQARARQAVAEAAAGRQVALVCSGDAGVYAMATMALEAVEEHGAGVELEVVPGVTAALAAAALVGAPLAHDHAVISLSDLHTPWASIERRLRAAAEADLVVALYNPRSAARHWQLDAARRIFLEHRAPDTPVAVVTDAFRSGQSVDVTTLEGLDTTSVGMTTCVLLGATTTRLVAGHMLTPRYARP